MSYILPIEPGTPFAIPIKQKSRTHSKLRKEVILQKVCATCRSSGHPSGRPGNFQRESDDTPDRHTTVRARRPDSRPGLLWMRASDANGPQCGAEAGCEGGRTSRPDLDAMSGRPGRTLGQMRQPGPNPGDRTARSKGQPERSLAPHTRSTRVRRRGEKVRAEGVTIGHNPFNFALTCRPSTSRL